MDKTIDEQDDAQEYPKVKRRENEGRLGVKRKKGCDV
jgi:hypothetical protein